MSDTTTSVTVWLAEVRDTIALVEFGSPDEDAYVADDILVPVAESLLTGVVTALEIHRPIRRYWCQECQTSYPCNTRREITAALLGETVDD